MRCFTRFADEILWCQGCLEKSVSTTGLFITLINRNWYLDTLALFPKRSWRVFPSKTVHESQSGRLGLDTPKPWEAAMNLSKMCLLNVLNREIKKRWAKKSKDTCIFPFFLNESQIDGNQRGDMKQHLYSLNSTRRRVLVSKSQICKAWANHKDVWCILLALILARPTTSL